MTNTNPETGIRYGVVSLNSLHPDVFEEFINNGRNLTAEAAEKEAKAEYVANFTVPNVTAAEEWDDWASQEFWDSYAAGEESYELETEGMKLGLSTLGGAYNVWVYESPHTGWHGVCSPCCPNAGNIDTEGIFECYTVPRDWFLPGEPS